MYAIRSYYGIEAIVGAEVVYPLAEHREIAAGQFRDPDNPGAHAERIGLEVAEKGAAAAVACYLFVVVAPDTEGEAFRQELVGRKVEVKLRAGPVICVVVLCIEHDSGREIHPGSCLCIEPTSYNFV